MTFHDFAVQNKFILTGQDIPNSHYVVGQTEIRFCVWQSARAAAFAECAEISRRYADHYPEDIFDPMGTSIDCISARAIRVGAMNMASAIEARAKETP